jgi:hypothetical protein
VTATEPATEARTGPRRVSRPAAPAAPAWRRWAPAAVGLAFVAGILLDTGTPAADILRYAGYALLGVVLPGTLTYRALRRTPHTLVEDLAVGAAMGLVLELAALGAFSVVGAQRWLWLWPLAVVVPFLAVPALRRHWLVRGYRPAPLGWSWAVVAVLAGFTSYLAESFLRRNPILPADERQLQYIDLAYQLSIAGESTHHFPPGLPQAAGEPLPYHWFGFAHLASASLVSGVDLPTVFFRLAVPALCALAIVLVAVVGWRISGRPYVGAGAAALMFTIGEFGFENGVRQLFGTQTTFIVWGSPSMTYSWVLLLPLIALVADRLGRDSSARPDGRDAPVPTVGPGAWVLAGLLMLGSAGAKASSLPVLIGALGFTALGRLLTRRRVDRAILIAAALAVGALALATVAVFRLQGNGLRLDPFSGLTPYLAGAADRPLWASSLLGAGALIAFVLNLQLRLAGIPALLWLRRGRLGPVRTFLLGGALTGPAIYLVLGHPGSSNQYFVRTAFAFGVVLSAWGYAEVLDRSRLSSAGRVRLAVGALAFAVVLTDIQLRWPARLHAAAGYAPVVPLLVWACALAFVAEAGALAWSVLSGRWPGLRGRGAVVLLTGVLVAGAPGLVMDARAGRQFANGGAYAVVPMPRSRVLAARWVFDHSRPDDVLATNVHCRVVVNGLCDSRTFWLSAYAERSVLVEGWAFAPRVVGAPGGPYVAFWDQQRLARNDAAFAEPTAAGLAELRGRGVRWLVLDREVSPEPPALAGLTDRRYDNGRVAVFELR